MRKLTVLLLLLVTVLALVQSAPVAATEPVMVGGTLDYIAYQVGEPKTAGGNIFFNTVEDAWWYGAFDGAAFDECLVIVHAAGNWTYKATSEFTGVVDGRTGGLTMRLNGSRPDAFSDWTGTWVILGGSGELANLRGEGVFYGAGAPGFGVLGTVTYEGQIHFNPAS